MATKRTHYTVTVWPSEGLEDTYNRVLEYRETMWGLYIAGTDFEVWISGANIMSVEVVEDVE